MVGGMSWHSTLEYYRHLNQAVNERHGNNTNPPIMLDSLDQNHIHRLQEQGRWDCIEEILLHSARKLEAAGVDALMLCANTPHKVYPGVAAGVRIPILHIADATGEAITRMGLARVGLLGTRYTMGEGFIIEWLREHHGIEVLVPPPDGQERIHAIIQKELTMGQLSGDSRCVMLEQVDALREMGVEGLVLGCTELPLVLGEKECALPVFDTLRLHADMAVDFILSNGME